MMKKKHQLRQNCEIILASSSRVRKRILAECHVDFTAMSPLFNEDKAKKGLGAMKIKDKAMFLAKNKALSVSVKYPNHYVIGADQICEIEDIELEKSKSHKQSIAQLKKLSGKIHYQNNAVCVYKNGRLLFKKFSRVKLKMRLLKDSEIKSYIDLDDSFNSAGGYKFESYGKHLFEDITGDYYSIMGLNIVAILGYFHKNSLISFI
jgi:septum formation protein